MASDFGLQTSVTNSISITYTKLANWSTSLITSEIFPLPEARSLKSEALLAGPEEPVLSITVYTLSNIIL